MRRLLLVLLVACKRDAPAEPKLLTVEEACAKLISFRGDAARAMPFQTEKCAEEYGAMSKELRVCTDACVRKSSDARGFEDCRDDCNGLDVPPFLVCSKVSFENAPFKACMAKHEKLQKERPDLYKCWSRCGRRAAEGPSAVACDEACKVP